MHIGIEESGRESDAHPVSGQTLGCTSFRSG